MLDSLMRWARGEGLLRGQRNRWLEPVLRKFRNSWHTAQVVTL